MPCLDVFEVMLREFLLEIEAGMKGDGVLPLGASAYDKYIHSSCFHYKFTLFPRLDKGPGQRGSGPQRTDSALQGATPEELHEEHWPVSDACPFLETKPGRKRRDLRRGAVSRKTPEKGANIPLSVPGTRSGMEQGPFRKAGMNPLFSSVSPPCPSLFN